ncbi:MAG: nucleotidyltransferase [Lachnospiraceae bacterium]|nr:nucleotidyltransferase [Lachnospiraceae bacterium]
MKTAGIIAEYNPFHQGHRYHIEETRRLTGADYIIVVMSGNFTQRGQAAIMDKYGRAKLALENGADLVLELPVCFAVSSASYFASGGVSLLDKLGVVDFLSFGSEGGSTEELLSLSSFLLEEPENFKAHLQTALKQGYTYPKARALALEKSFPEGKSELVSSPNNILALEYCTALLAFHSSIIPLPVKRLHSGYHDTGLSPTGYSSATAIRRVLIREIPALLEEQLPSSVYKYLKKEYDKTLPLDINDFSPLLQYRLLMEQPENLTLYADVHRELADRISGRIYSFTTYEDFCDQLKTKELTHSRISRSLLHILLGLKEDALQATKEEGYSRYAKILGFRKSAAPLLHAIKANTSIPLIPKLADSAKSLDPVSRTMLEADIRAAHIYEGVLCSKFNRPFRNEYSRQFPIL